MLYALYRIGYHSKMTRHGFRALFSTIANEAESTPTPLNASLHTGRKTQSGRRTIEQSICPGKNQDDAVVG